MVLVGEKVWRFLRLMGRFDTPATEEFLLSLATEPRRESLSLSLSLSRSRSGYVFASCVCPSPLAHVLSFALSLWVCVCVCLALHPGAGPSGYSVERIDKSPDLVVSAAIMAGFLPVFLTWALTPSVLRSGSCVMYPPFA